MERLTVKTLILSDSDLGCNCPDKTLSGLTLSDTNFIMSDLAEYELIVYSGSRGTKILKSVHFQAGKVGG